MLKSHALPSSKTTGYKSYPTIQSSYKNIYRRMSLGYFFGYFIILLVFNASWVQAQIDDINFERISTEQGLSEGSIYAIMQDSEGYLWFGTKDGLNKYDGYNFVQYKSDPFDSTSLSDNHIYSIIEDNSGIIWIGSFNGLNRYDRLKDNFTRYIHDPSDPRSISDNRIRSLYSDRYGVMWIGTDDGLDKFETSSSVFKHYKSIKEDENSLSNNKISCIYEDNSGALWIGTKGGGLDRFDRTENIFAHFKCDPDNPNSLSQDEVNTIYEDNSNQIWVGTAEGLNKFNPKNNKFTRYLHDAKKPNGLSSDEIRSIIEDKSGVMWIGTKGGGVNVLDKNSGKFTSFKYDSNDPNSLSDDRVQPIFEDNSGLIWVGTKGGGLNKVNLNKKKFRHYKYDSDDPYSLSNDQVYAIYQNNSGDLWIGTEGGLNKLNSDTRKFLHYLHDSGDLNTLGNDRVWAITEDHHKNLWLGFKSGGLDCFNSKINRFIHFTYNPSNPDGISDDIAVALHVDHTGALWVGTYNGLDKLIIDDNLSASSKFIHYRHDPNDPTSLSNNRIISILEDKDNVLWVGTYIGLNKYDHEKNQFIHYKNDPNKPNCLSDNRVWAIYEDEKGILWLGTNSGLNKFNKTSEQFEYYTEENGLPNNVVYGIINDDNGYLWVSTNKGLSKFDPINETFINYDVNDGLQSNEFNPGAYFKSKSGEILFGGKNGFNRFHPNKIKSNPHIPPIKLTAFKKFNKNVVLDTLITEIKQIELSYKENFISFEFAALDFTFPQKNQYAYKLEGFDEDWINCGNRRFASYTNLDGGEYIFRVRGSNNDGIWNKEGTSLQIKINPPFWQTLWFRILSIAIIASLVILIYRIRINRMRRQNEKLEILVNEKTEELKEKYKESENIMQNVDEGLFLLNENFEIGAQYSKALEEILDDENLAHRNFTEMFENKIPEKDISTVERYLNLMIENNIDETTLLDLNPLSKIEVSFNGNGDESSISKYLDFKFRRILGTNKRINLFATVQDITEKVIMAEKLKDSEEQANKQMELLFSILHVEPSMLQEFIQSVENEIKNIKVELKVENESKNYQKILRNIYRSMHMIKGNASLLDLKFFANIAHAFEDKITEIQEKPDIGGSDFVPLIMQLAKIKHTLKEVNDLIERMSKIHDQFRPKRKFEDELLIRSLKNLVEHISKDALKSVDLDHSGFSGNDIPYKSRLLVKDLMIQLLRNAVSHGIETPEERKKVKKDPLGKIVISTAINGPELEITVKDDGRGIQTAQLKSTVIDSGKLTPEELERMDEVQIRDLIFLPGISTSSNIDLTSGRGIGMDIIQQKITEHKGRIKINSVAGKYCEFRVSLPMK